MFLQSQSDHQHQSKFFKQNHTSNFQIKIQCIESQIMGTQGLFISKNQIQQQQLIKSDQNYSLDLNFQQEQISYQLQYYLKNLNQQLEKKYLSQSIIKQDIYIQDIITQVKTNKKNKIKKQQCKRHNFLQIKLNSSKINISKLWMNRLLQFLKINMQNYQISFKQISSIKKQIVPNLTIKQLIVILKNNPWIDQLIQNDQKKFLNSVYTSNLMNESKLILLETYDIFIASIKNPENLKTWDRSSKRIYNESIEIYSRFKDKAIPQICQLAMQLYSKYKQDYKFNKCSPLNNITYRWIKYFKDLTVESQFVNEYSNRQTYAHLIDIFSQTPSIQNIREAFKIDWFVQYLKKNKIDSSEIIKQIMMNPKVNLLSKMNMLTSLRVIIDALENPCSLEKWR